MDWRSIRFDWNHARAFLVTAEEGSFSAAGRALGMAQPTIGRQVAALEEELGVLLFDRVNGLTLTPTGLELLEHVRSMGSAASRVSLTATGQATALDGPIGLSASQIHATFLLPPVLAEIHALHPGIEIELVATNATSDLRRREADIALRSFRPRQPDLVGRKLREDQAILYATPAYLARIGNPGDPLAFSEHGRIIGFDRTDTFRVGLDALGFRLKPESFRVFTEDQMVQLELAKQGVGAVILPTYVGDPEPALVPAVPGMTPFPVPLWLVTHQELQTSRRIRVVFDLLAEGLRIGG
ncbi:MAG: LysR family transcriptional regulator [Myxococcota bacterium]